MEKQKLSSKVVFEDLTLCEFITVEFFNEKKFGSKFWIDDNFKVKIIMEKPFIKMKKGYEKVIAVKKEFGPNYDEFFMKKLGILKNKDNPCYKTKTDILFAIALFTSKQMNGQEGFLNVDGKTIIIGYLKEKADYVVAISWDKEVEKWKLFCFEKDYWHQPVVLLKWKVCEPLYIRKKKPRGLLKK